MAAAACACVLVGTARADEPERSSEPSVLSDADRARARDHYQRGLRHYKLREFDQAIAELRESYRIFPSPQLLFNLGQASRLAGKLEQAIYYYRTYLRDAPRSANAKDARRLISKLEEELAERQALEPVRPEPQKGQATESQENRESEVIAAPVPAPGSSDRAEAGSGRGLKIAGLVVAGAGLALAGTGVAFGLSARSASSDIDEVSATGGSWSPDNQDTYDRGERHEKLAVIFGIGGASALATGAVLYYLGWRQSSVSASLQRSSASLMVGTWF